MMTVYEVSAPGQDQALYVSFGKDAVLVSPGKDYVVEAVRAVRGKKKVALKNKEFQALLEKLDPGQSLSVAILGKSVRGASGADGVPAMLKGLAEKVEAVGGSVRVEKDIEIELSIATRSDREARELREPIDKGLKAGLAALALLGSDRKELGLVLEVLKSTRVGARGKVTTIKARLNPDAFEELFKKAD